MKGTWVEWVEAIYEMIPKIFFQTVLMEWIGRERSIEGREFQLRSASVENELRFNLVDWAERVLDQQKEKGCKTGRLCIGFLTQEMKNKILFSSRVYIRGNIESEIGLSL